MNRLKILKTTLYLGAIYFFIGAIAHYFGLTLFPWFDGGLYTPYQDTVIAFVAVVLAYFLVVVAHDPIRNKDILRAVIISAATASVISIAIIWKVDFIALGAQGKKLQTVVEGLLGFIWTGVLMWLYPRRED